MSELISPVKQDFTKILEVDEQDRGPILEAAQKEKERMGKELNIYKENTVNKGRGNSKKTTKETVFCK